MKQIFIWATALLMILALFSCDKRSQGLDLSPSEKEESGGGLASLKKSLYTASSEVLSYDVEQNKEEDKEGLRASVLNVGYKKPDLDVSKAEFVNHDIKAYWSIMGEGVSTSGTVSNFLDEKPNIAYVPTENSLALYKEGNKRKLRMYCQVDEDFNVQNKFAVLALDGELRDGRYLDFKGATAPNKNLVGMKLGDKVEGYHLPIMTDVIPFKSVFIEQNLVHYKARGVLIGISVINSMCKAIDVKRIVFEKNNALWFEGSFDMQTAENGTNILAKSSEGLSSRYKAMFVGSRGYEAITYPVYNGASPAYKLDPALGQTVESGVKEAAPVFYIWAYPRDIQKKLKFKVVYTTYGKSEEKECKYAVELLQEGLKEGHAYRLPIVLDEDDIAEESVSLGFTTPLDFVAEQPAINKAGTGFVFHHNIPESDVVANLKGTGVGYYTFDEAVNLFSKPFLANYYLPTEEQWLSIVSKNPKVRFSPGQEELSSVTEPARVGESTVQDYTSDYITVLECGKYVTYAIRFKNSPQWKSAWRYSMIGTFDDRRMLVQCVPLSGQTGITLNGIKDPEFFTSQACTIRVFPCYGYQKSDTAIRIDGYGAYGFYWSATSSSWADARMLRFLNTYALINTFYPSRYLSVRPFRRP